VWWERELTVQAANPDDAHRPLEKSHNLAASLSHVETRQLRPDYTLRWDGKLYQIERPAVVSRLRGAKVRVELRWDGSMAVRYGERYLRVEECAVAEKPKAAKMKSARKHSAGQRGIDWNKNLDLKKGPKVWHAVEGNRRMTKAGRKWREGKVRPLPGNSPHDRLVSRGIFSSSKKVCDDPLRATFFPSVSGTILRLPGCVFQAWRNLSVRCGPSKIKPWGGVQPPPLGRPQAR
jgi:hypothetical protein